MKILLVGEYSRLHNSLKEGLVSLGHEVVIVGTGDGFKNYNVDYSIYPKFIGHSAILQKIKNGIYRFTGIDIEKSEKGIRFYFLLPKLKGYDHVQLINSDAIETHPALQIKLYKKLFRQNKKTSLLVCGDETPVIDYLLKGEMTNSVLSPYLADKSLKSNFEYTLKYTTKPYRQLFEWVNNNVNALITSDLDYKTPMDRMGYKNTLIPNPVNTSAIAFTPLKITHKVVLFLGINRHSYLKKGIVYFEEALAIIQQKYPDKAEIIITENVPYTEYTKLYKKAHILLDYVYGYDQGYNALEAMAAGKVVFTGAGPDFMQYYNLSESVAVNALPDVDYIVKELSYLIENPAEIEAIGYRARAFIEKEHNYISIAQQYLEVWGENPVN
jgi:glycosyltransferase involved in cell wall biosynthesis